jgi:hypothetical protein
MSLRTALARPLTRTSTAIAGKTLTSIEGSVRPGPWSLPVTGAVWSVGAPSGGSCWNAWQLGGAPWGPGPQLAVVEACKALYAGTVAMCPVGHFIRLPDGGKVRVESSDAARIFLVDRIGFDNRFAVVGVEGSGEEGDEGRGEKGRMR